VNYNSRHAYAERNHGGKFYGYVVNAPRISGLPMALAKGLAQAALIVGGIPALIMVLGAMVGV